MLILFGKAYILLVEKDPALGFEPVAKYLPPVRFEIGE